MISACKSQEEVTALSRAGQEIFDRMEASPKPIVAAVYGTCLGGGLEVGASDNVAGTCKIIEFHRCRLSLLASIDWQ